VIDSVIERFDVQLHDPVRSAVYDLTQSLKSLMRTALWPKPVRTLSESGFEDWFKHRFRGCLDQAISDRRYT